MNPRHSAQERQLHACAQAVTNHAITGVLSDPPRGVCSGSRARWVAMCQHVANLLDDDHSAGPDKFQTPTGPTLRQRAAQRLRWLQLFDKLTFKQAWLRAGWGQDGEWTCAQCGTMIGCNLNGEKPFGLAREHVAAGCPKERLESLKN